MSDERKCTKRDQIMAMRVGGRRVSEAFGGRVTENEIKRLFPLPKVTRPRVVRDPDGVEGLEFRVVDDVMQAHWRHDTRWHLKTEWMITRKRAAAWADLFANPSETVESDE